MAYTPSANKTVANPPRSNFGGLRTDGNRIGMTGATGNNFQTQDATPTTPIKSPVTVNTTTTLVVPTNAVSVLFLSSTAAVTISEDSTSSVNFSLAAGIPIELDCANQNNIYLTSGGTGVMNFAFKLV